MQPSHASFPFILAFLMSAACAAEHGEPDNDEPSTASQQTASAVSADAATPSTADGGPVTPPPGPSSAPAVRSAGCGAATWPAEGAGTIEVDGVTRSYIVALPESYRADRAYRLVYAWHGLGGTAERITRGFYGLEARADDSTIFVAGQGLPTSGGSGGAGWPNTGGRDVAFVKALHERLRTSYCIDEARVFSVGMSYGGIMSNTLGCQMGDTFRAIAPIAGSGPATRGGACKGQVAAWLAHGNQDTVVTFAAGERSRDHWLQANRCQPTGTPTPSSPCVSYAGCDPEHPVHFCEFDGGHTVPAFASAAIWQFFTQF